MSGNTSASGGYLTPTISVQSDDDAVLDGILHDLVVGITGLGTELVYPRWQPQPPTMPPFTVNWAAIGVSVFDPIANWPEQVHHGGYPSAPGNTVQLEHQSMNVLATFYGPNAGQYARIFFAGLTIRQNLDVLGTYGIKLQRTGNIMHVPELVNTQYVQRYDVTFYLVRETDRTYAIEDVLGATVDVVSDDSSFPPAEAVVNLP